MLRVNLELSARVQVEGEPFYLRGIVEGLTHGRKGSMMFEKGKSRGVKDEGN